MKQPSDTKFVITKAPAGDPWTWIVWLPIGQRWLQTAGGKTFTAHGAGVPGFKAALELVIERLADLERMSDELDVILLKVR